MSRQLYTDYGWNQKALQRYPAPNIAAASTSTKPESSDSSDSLLELSQLKSLISAERDLLHLFFPSDSSLEVMAGIWLGVPEKCLLRPDGHCLQSTLCEE
ncbi:hypothetical protein HAX54_014837 [Datura stramonium]|uniref:Uncharacterized protein n=1 Tax=Datura stramonium TaxID=4076 RepID=A0ABS8TNT0_DATST|nr:hypothetical protein [Datura stramonium]